MTAPFVALTYIIGTCSMLWLVPRASINGMARPLRAIGSAGGRGGWSGRCGIVVFSTVSPMPRVPPTVAVSWLTQLRCGPAGRVRGGSRRGVVRWASGAMGASLVSFFAPVLDLRALLFAPGGSKVGSADGTGVAVWDGVAGKAVRSPAVGIILGAVDLFF